jgi:23S rRNA U2552 (ribose-2'-O)-methylase RlmE/FtsJ
MIIMAVQHMKYSDLTKNCVFLQLTLQRLGDKRGVDTDKIDVDADKSFVQVRKKIFKSPRFDAIRSLDGQIRRYVRDQSYPFEAGIHLVSAPMAELIETQLIEFKKERQEKVANFVAAWDSIIGEMNPKLRALFDSDDYRDLDRVEDEFQMSWQFFMFGAPLSMEQFNTGMLKRHSQQMQHRFEEALEQARMVLRETILEMVKNLRVACEPDHYGAAKRIHSSTVNKLKGFLETFDLRNVTNDRELQRQVHEMQELLGGVDAEGLRSIDGLRQRVQLELTGIEKAIQEAVEVNPTRRIRTRKHEG